MFANRGIARYIGSSAEWCRIEGTPGDYTVDTLNVVFDALPATIDRREATVSVTDSVTTLQIHVIQDRTVPSAIATVSMPNGLGAEVCYDLQGRRIEGLRKKGIFLQKHNGCVEKRFSR